LCDSSHSSPLLSLHIRIHTHSLSFTHTHPHPPHPQATEALRITAPELIRLGVMDTIVPEPLGGAHADPVSAFPAIKGAIMSTFREYEHMSEREIQLDR